MYKNFFKRTIDFVVSFLGILFFLPLLTIITITLFFINGGKPFFFQRRPGKNGKIFKLIKFKSMTDKTDSFGKLLPYEDRITKVGLFIRKMSLDELPQIINILKGDMSIIGPRPLLEEYLPLYNKKQKRRHEIRPGLSGWAQVNGRNSISWQQKFELDIWYVDNVSFKLDFLIFLKTFKKAIFKEGINASETTNMPLFNGEN